MGRRYLPTVNAWGFTVDYSWVVISYSPLASTLTLLGIGIGIGRH